MAPSSKWYKRWFKKPNDRKPTSRNTDVPRLVLSGVKLALRGLSDSLDGVPAPGLQGALKGVLFILDNMDQAKQNVADLEHLAESLASYELLFEAYKVKKLPAALRQAILVLTNNIHDTYHAIDQIVDHCRVRRIIESSEDAQLFIRQLRIIDNALNHFKISTASYTSLTVSESLEINQRLLLDKLSIEVGAYYNSADRELTSATCLLNTRTEIRRRVDDWLFDANAPSVFWMRGMAGTGKSTIAQTMAEHYDEQGYLAGHFFFSRDMLSRYSGAKFFSTLAAQLCSFDARLVPHVANLFLGNPAQPRIREQFSSLMMKPLLALSQSDPDATTILFPMLIVVDAMDECNDPVATTLILNQILGHPLLRRTRPWLKILITSRPEHHIREAFDRVVEPKEAVYIEHDLDKDDVRADLEAYLKNGFEEIRANRPECFPSRKQTWPFPAVISMFVGRSQGLFIYASTILKFVGDPRQHPAQQLRLVVTIGREKLPFIYSGLDYLYRQVLSQDPAPERVRYVIGAIALVTKPLSIGDLEALLDLEPGEAHVTLQWLPSLLVIPHDKHEPIRLYHRSFYDFVTTKARSGDLYVEPEILHGKLARSCIKIIEVGWPPRDGDSDCGEKPSILRYACKSWSSHLCGCNKADPLAVARAADFVFDSLRLWFDAVIQLELLDDILAAIIDIFRSHVVVLRPDIASFLHQEMDRFGVLISQYEYLRYTDTLHIAGNLHGHAVATASKRDSPKYRYHLGQVKRKMFQFRLYTENLNEAMAQLDSAIDELGDDDNDLRNLILTEKAICHRLYRRLPELLKSRSLLETVVTAMRDDDLNKPACLNSMALTLVSIYNQNGDPVVLDDAIDYYRRAIILSPSEETAFKPIFMNNLSVALRLRFAKTGNVEDIAEAVDVSFKASEDPQASPSLSFKAAVNLAMSSRLLGPESALHNYLMALKKARRISWSTLRDDIAHQLNRDAATCARDAVAEAVKEGELETALECAEHAASTFWLGGLNIRAPFFSDGADNLEARKLAEQLEVGGTEEPTVVTNADRMVHTHLQDRETLVKEHRELAERGQSSGPFSEFWFKSTVSSLPRLSTIIFLTATTQCCHALVLRPEGHPQILPVDLPAKFEVLQSVAADVKDLWNPTFRRAERSDRDILQFLWDSVVQPIIQALNLKRIVGDPPRVWWCPLGPFADLPVHAASDFASQPADFATNYITSSYITTLDTFASRLQTWDPSTEKGRYLFFDASEDRYDTPRPLEFDQLQKLIPYGKLLAVRTASFSLKYILEQIRSSPGIHIVSRGEQRNEDPAEYRFVLPGQIHLELRHFHNDTTIPNFIYVSTFPTTAGWAKGPITCRLGYDLFNAGCRSVVVQQAPTSDEEGALVTAHFYSGLKQSESGVDFRMAAKALHHAGIKLREASQYRLWARYIHVGI